MNLIIKSIFGSHLYGTSTPESDMDYKGIYLPTLEDCLLNKISTSISKTTGKANSKNTAEDVDEEIFSLQYFVKLAYNGEMIVLDLLHTPDNLIVESSSIWKKLRDNRSMFYSKKLSGYLGYIRKQTAKYGIKGSRLEAMQKVIDYLSSFDSYKKMSEIWEGLPINEYCMFVPHPKDERFRMYECCGRKFPETITVEYALNIVATLHDSYGARALAAKENKGIDWKAVSHAFRAGLQLKEIYTTGDLIYPLKDAEFIKDIKTGKFHYQDDNIAGKLEDMLTEVEALAVASDFRESLNYKELEQFVLECYK